MSIRDNRISIQLMEQAGAYIAREAGRSTLITPTRVALSKDGKDATIFVSVYPTTDTDNALAFLLRHKDLFRNSLRKSTRIGRIPYIRFEFDQGEANRQHIDDISREITGGANPEA
ncbi:MAG: ribosome-binding factor A [Patescibacteria group bacterium]